MKIASTIEATKLRQIGAGQGMNSEVFLCHDPQLDGEIVIKEVPVSNFSMPDEFFSEAQRLYANKHPRVVPLHYACRDADKIRIAMPYFVNGSLQDKINQGPISTRQVIWWAQQFLSGLHYIHSNGFIHFDIKPSNILIHDDASVMISDFGQARPTNHLGVGEIPPMYPGHLTPEFFQYSMATKQSDIYQVGLTLYRMCNGDDLFKSQMPATGQELRDQILNGTFPNRNKFLPHVPNRLRRVIRKAFKVNPAERQQTAMELMNELGQVNSLLDWEYSKHGGNCYWQRKGENHEYHIQMIKNASNQWFIEGFTIRLDNKQKRARTDWCAGPFNTFLQADQEVVLPLCVLRRFDCLLQPTKQKVLERAATVKHDAILNKISGYDFNNTSKFDFQTLLKDPDNIAANLRNYIQGFSANVRVIFERFEFDKQVSKMDEHNLLYSVIQLFAGIDLSMQRVSNMQMGYIFEEFIRRFSENAEAGDHYTPREVIKLMVNLILNEDQSELMQEGKIVQVGDFACGTGGMLSEATRFIQELNPNTQVEVFGQEINPKSYAIACADLLIKGQNAGHIAFGNSLTEADGHKGLQVRYALMNPPFGVEWKHYGDSIVEEHEEKGFDGRYGAGLPRTSDGSLLFLQHMVSKMKKDEKGSRMAIIFNGSPLFTGDAGSGESGIRRWLIEEDLLEGIVALPDQLFYNTGISTYVWILSNRKNNDLAKGAVRKGKIQLVDATGIYTKMRKSLGNKRNEITDIQIAEITRLYGDFKENEKCKIFDSADLGYKKITVERPLQLNFMISSNRIDNLYNESAFAKLCDEEAYFELTRKKDKKTADIKKLEEMKAGKKLQEKIVEILNNNISDEVYKNRDDFLDKLKPLFKQVPEVKAGLWKAIYMGLSERDETADICLDNKGMVESDPTLRDTENVPLKEDIERYFEREISPHIPNAWYDESKTKIGYEIPFTRYFYKYELLESSNVLKQNVIDLEENIQTLLKKVLA